MKAIVLDDHKMVGQAIAGVLTEIAGWTVLQTCTTVDDACRVIQIEPPDILVLDVNLGTGNYLEAASLLSQLKPDAKLLFITGVANFLPPSELAAITFAVIDKSKPWDHLLQKISEWQQQEWAANDQFPGNCQAQLRAIDQLSKREREILWELGRGLLNKQIAKALQLSPSTVETYRKHVANKLGVSGSELVRLATLYRYLRGGHEQNQQTE